MSNPDYDLCLAVESPEEGNGLPKIRGKFCWLDSEQGLIPENWEHELIMLNESLMIEVYERFTKNNLADYNLFLFELSVYFLVL